jgi:copper chaperone CopZ
LPTIRVRIVGFCSPDRQQDLREAVMQIAGVELAAIDYEAAEAAFRYDEALLMGSPPPKQGRPSEQILTRLDERLRGVSQGTFSARPLSSVPRDKQTQVEFQVGVLHCKGCRYGVYQVLAKIYGVERASVDSQTGQVLAWIDPAKTDRAALADALVKARVPLKSPPATP